MRIIQLLPTLSYGDAVGNNTIALKDELKKYDVSTNIYAENIDPRLPKNTCLSVSKMPTLYKDDIIIYHLSTGSKLNEWLGTLECRKIVIYHNITPPSYFEGYNKASKKLCEDGLRGLARLANKVEYCIADSDYNRENMLEYGYQCPIDILPILIAFRDYEKIPDQTIIKKYKGDSINIIFAGRLAPNKKHEDIIRTFYYYKKYVNSNSRLFLVGSYDGMEYYYEALKTYVKELDLEDVYFTGHISFDKLLAYYHIADLFLCMSEHEGFCVPLVEAMYFDIPIIAYDSSAISGTLGGSGCLVKEKDYPVIAELIQEIMTNEDLKERILENQRERLLDFEHSKIKDMFHKYLTRFIEGLA